MSDENLALHAETGLWVDPEKGDVFGRRGGRLRGGYNGGYALVIIGGRKNTRTLCAHRVIYEAVHGPIPEGMQINHINGIKNDNRIANLELVTPKENIRHAHATGLGAFGTRHGNARLTDDLVRQIRATTGQITATEWGRRLGVCRTTVGLVRRGVWWRHVT